VRRGKERMKRKRGESVVNILKTFAKKKEEYRKKEKRERERENRREKIKSDRSFKNDRVPFVSG
jgi:hypothetical protein